MPKLREIIVRIKPYIGYVIIIPDKMHNDVKGITVSNGLNSPKYYMSGRVVSSGSEKVKPGDKVIYASMGATPVGLIAKSGDKCVIVKEEFLDAVIEGDESDVSPIEEL